MKDFMNLMKQAKDIQSKMQDAQNSLQDLEVSGESGAGMVEITLNGKGDMKGLKIDPSLIKPEDSEMLEDLIIAAHTDAKAKMEAAVQEKMQEVTGGLNLPAGMNPFG